MDRSDPASIPWYRQLWPWLLMTMPAAALVGGGITLWLALSSNNALVVDDYYREGKAINRTLARDREAVRLGLAGELRRDADGTPRFALRARGGGALPPFVTVRVVHATRAELDRAMTLAATGDGHYASPGALLPESGRWNFVIEDPDRHWRLVASTGDPSAPVHFGEAAR